MKTARKADLKKKRSAGAGKKRKGNSDESRLSLYLAFAVTILLTVIVAVGTISLRARLRSNEARAQQLEEEILTERQRAADIEEYRRYTETDAYIEEVAREKLGLIYEGETVFKEEK